VNLDELDQALTGEAVTTTGLLAALMVVAVGLALAFVVGRIAKRRFGRPDQQSEQIAKLSVQVLRWGIVALTLAWALNIVGLDLGWLTIIVVVLVVAGALTIRPLAENLASGLMLTTRPAFGVGDEIEIDGVSGEIIEFTDRSTVLRLGDGRRVHMPNSQVIASTVTVYTTDQARRSSVELAVSETVDIDQAEVVILEALAGLAAVLPEPSPVVQARSLDEGVGLVLKVWHSSDIRSANMAIDQTIRAVKPALEAAGMPLAPSFDGRIESVPTVPHQPLSPGDGEPT
jgi:small conductance mechanosensitive channel